MNKNVVTLMKKYWCMSQPKLIISVTGGAKRFNLKSRLKNSFKRGLVNAATSTGHISITSIEVQENKPNIKSPFYCAGAWIVTGGTNAGVMEFVGEALKEYVLTEGVIEQPVVALGIATWGIVDNKEALISEDVRLLKITN